MLRTISVLIVTLAAPLYGCMTDPAGDQARTATQGDELASDPGTTGAQGSGADEAKSMVAADPKLTLTEQTDSAQQGVITPFASHSFTATCIPTNGWVTDNSTGAIVFAFSDGGCRRFNGTIGPPVSWSGTCFGDVSNCNGNIVCQNHCP